jgi:hypothetical protein
MEPSGTFDTTSEVGPRPASRAAGSADAMRDNPAPIWPDFLVGQMEPAAGVLSVDVDPFIRHVMAQALLAVDRISLVAQAGSARGARREIARHEFDVLQEDRQCAGPGNCSRLQVKTRAQADGSAADRGVM